MTDGDWDKNSEPKYNANVRIGVYNEELFIEEVRIFNKSILMRYLPLIHLIAGQNKGFFKEKGHWRTVCPTDPSSV